MANAKRSLMQWILVSLSPPPPTPHPRTHTHTHTQAAAVRRTCKAASSQAACQHRQAVHYGPCSTK